MTKADDSTIRDAFMELARAEAGPVVCEIWDRMDAVNDEHGRQLRALFMELHAAKYAGENHEHVLAYDLHPFRVATGGWEIVNGEDTYLIPTSEHTTQEDTDDTNVIAFYSRVVLNIINAEHERTAFEATS